MKDYLEYQGTTDLTGSPDVIREAFRVNLIVDGETWMQMLKSRNLTSHSYNEDTATEIANVVLNVYYASFKLLEQKLNNLSQHQLGL